MPLGEALWENPELQLSIPMKFRRAPPLPPPPGLATCTLLLDMLAAEPDARPTAKQLEARVCCALEEDSHWQKAGWRCLNGWDHYGPTLVTLTTHPDHHTSSVCKLQPLYRSCSQGQRTRMMMNFRGYFCHKQAPVTKGREAYSEVWWDLSTLCLM